MFGCGIEKAANIATRREMLTHRAQNDDAHAVVFIKRFEDFAQLVAFDHGNCVHRGTVKDDVSALTRSINLYPKAVQIFICRMGHGLASHWNAGMMIPALGAG